MSAETKLVLKIAVFVLAVGVGIAVLAIWTARVLP